MNVAIIGGGFTGLTAAYRLLQLGHKVTVFEKDKSLGGLAHGYRQANWDWSLEYAYHHIFTNDHAIISLVKEIGFTKNLLITRPKTATYIDGKIWQLDSPKSLLEFSKIPLFDRVRTGCLIAFLKLNPWWQPLSGFTVKDIFPALGGKKSWETIWEPLMIGKFGDYADEVAASWLWARIHKRTPSLGYFTGGFQHLINHLETVIIGKGGKIYRQSQIALIEQKNNKSFTLSVSDNSQSTTNIKQLTTDFDALVLTTPTPIAKKLMSQLTNDNHLLNDYFSAPNTIPHLWAQLLIVETKNPILPDSIYWLNINDRSFPFLAAVAHTHFMNKKYYGGNHITYFGNYLPDGHPYLSLSAKQLFAAFRPYIHRLSYNLKFDRQLANCNLKLFTGPFAQPVHQVNYKRKAPQLVTPLKNVYLANMDSIYPWDRGTNYAVELGEKVAQTIHQQTE